MLPVSRERESRGAVQKVYSCCVQRGTIAPWNTSDRPLSSAMICSARGEGAGTNMIEKVLNSTVLMWKPRKTTTQHNGVTAAVARSMWEISSPSA